MSNNLSLEDAIKVAVQSTITFDNTGLDAVFVFGRQGTIGVYEDTKLKNSVSSTTLEQLNSKLESIAKCYKNVNLNQSIAVELNSHDQLAAIAEWGDWEEWANDSCLSSSDT